MPFFCLFFQESLRNPRKKQATAWQINLPVVAFSFCRYFFAMQKKWDYSLSCGLPILQKISLRRRESRLAARALPSAVKSIFRRPRSAAFRRHPPYSCLEYGSVDYIIFAPAHRRALPSLSIPRGYHFLFKINVLQNISQNATQKMLQLCFSVE